MCLTTSQRKLAKETSNNKENDVTKTMRMMKTFITVKFDAQIDSQSSAFVSLGLSKQTMISISGLVNA